MIHSFILSSRQEYQLGEHPLSGRTGLGFYPRPTAFWGCGSFQDLIHKNNNLLIDLEIFCLIDWFVQWWFDWLSARMLIDLHHQFDLNLVKEQMFEYEPAIGKIWLLNFFILERKMSGHVFFLRINIFLNFLKR